MIGSCLVKSWLSRWSVSLGSCRSSDFRTVDVIQTAPQAGVGVSEGEG